MRRLLPLLLAACAPVSLPAPLYAPGGALFDAPWPSDARIRADGSLDLTGFPNPAGLPIIDTYLALASTQGGWSTNAPIYLRFDGPPPVDLPDPEASVAADSPLVLVALDGSLDRVPVTWQATTEQTTYQPRNLLAVAPLPGFPLHASTRYALVLTTAVAPTPPAFADALATDPVLAPLADALPDLGLDAADVSVATVFTTLDPTAEMAAVAKAAKSLDGGPLSQELTLVDENLFFKRWSGTYRLPNYQRGQRPFATEGGGFVLDDGVPEVFSWDEIPITVSTPLDLSNPPPHGWPIVLYAHGTGGDNATFADERDGLEPASVFARAGLVGIGFDQVLHGSRGTPDTNTSLHTFNFLNPESGRTVFRQGAADVVFLARALTKQPTTFRFDGGEIPIDPDKVLFMGHSQGGMTGAIAAPFVGDDVRAMVLSGAGGGMSLVMIERKDPTDLAALLSSVAGFEDGEEVTELHPVVGLLQWLVDVTDPISYAPSWYAERPDAESKPVSVLLTSGLLDAETPARTAEALAAAARMPQLSPGATHPEAFALRGLAEEPGPLQGNVVGYDEAPHTAAFSQWRDADHFVVFTDVDAARLYRQFLATGAEGLPVAALGR